MDYLSGKLKSTINLTQQNVKFNQLIKSSTKITNPNISSFYNRHPLNLNQNLLPKKQDLYIQSQLKIVQQKQKKSMSLSHLTYKKESERKRSYSNIRIVSRKSSEKKKFVGIKSQQNIKQIQEILKQKKLTTPINYFEPIVKQTKSVLKISDLMQNLNSELLLVIKQKKLKQNSDLHKLFQLTKQKKIKNFQRPQFLQEKLSLLKNFIRKYNIENGIIKVVNFVKLYKKVVSNFQLISLFDNFNDIISNNPQIPGIKFSYPDKVQGTKLAANKIISFFKMISAKNYVKKYASLMNKVKLIQKFWKKCLFVKKQRQKILKRIHQKIKMSQQIQNKFQKNWQMIKISKKIQVHICSLSLQNFKRMTLQRKKQFQNNQINRIFKSFETNTSVIYVSPIQISQDLIKYYKRLFKINNFQFSQKVTFVVPQNIKRIQSICQQTTTNYLLYSPKSLKKIKKMIKSYEFAYIIPSYPSMEYLNLSIQLNIPILSSSQSQSKVLSTKIGCQQIFQNVCKDAGFSLKMLKRIDSIYSQKQFINSLAVLIFKNQDIKRWYFKIDDEVCGRGIAYFNVKSITFLRSLHESKKNNLQQIINNYEEKKIIKLIKQQLKQKIKSKLKILHKQVYSNYFQYLSHFLTRGGLIQASPSNNFQNVSVSFFIQPNGDFNILGTYTKVSVNSRNVCQIIKAPSNIKLDYQIIIRNFYRKLYQKRKMYGYFTIDLLYQKEQNIIYPIGLDCFLNAQTCSLIFNKFVTGAKYIKDLNKFFIQDFQTNQKLKLSINSLVIQQQEKTQKSQKQICFYYCPKIELLQLENLGTFFKKCKFQNISYDIKSKTGTLFLLLDDLQSESIGFFCCQVNQKKLNQQIYHTVQFLSNNYRGKKGKSRRQIDELGFLRGYICSQSNNYNKKEIKIPQISLSDLF